MTQREERLLVIDNIRRAVAEGDSFRKVELGDPTVSDDDVRKVIEPFDTEHKSPKSKLLGFAARKIAESETRKRNVLTEIVGAENAMGIEGGAIITQNHFGIGDNTLARILAMRCGRGKRFNIVIQETNAFMKGYFGFLMRHCNTLPVSRSASYMAKNLKPALEHLLAKKHFILIYPEQEMWYNYKKPRALREGAYHYAAEFCVPVIPTFAVMENTSEVDEAGFYVQKHTLFVMPPLYPDPALSVRENREELMRRDAEAKRKAYESFYGESLDESFLPERDIAGFRTAEQSEA